CRRSRQVSDPTPIEITERELVVMTDELDELHHETMPTMYEAVAEWTERRHEDGLAVARKLGAASATRRRFLAGTGLTLGGLVLAACGSSSKSSGSGASTTVASAND